MRFYKLISEAKRNNLSIFAGIMKHLFYLSFLSVAMLISIESYSQTENQNYIEVHGTAEKTVVPDRITLSISIDENDYRKWSIVSLERDLKAALNGIGLDVRNALKVDDLSSSFYRRKAKNPDAVLSRRYLLEVSNAQEASDAIEALDKVHISNVYIQKEEYSKMDSLKIAVKADATRNARAIAAAMTEAIGQKLGKAIYIYEYESRADNNRGLLMKSMVSNDDSIAEEIMETGLEFKEIKISCNVTVRFCLPE